MFITGVSLSEYIRKRRLSKLFEELKTSNIKIIDLALKYQYESAISFSRAFKKLFGITPSECKKSTKSFKLFPIIKFNNNENYDELDYEIKNLNEITVYGKKTVSKTYDDSLYNIRKLYNEIKENGLYKKFNQTLQYGVSFYKKNKFTYLVGCEKEYSNTMVIRPGQTGYYTLMFGKDYDLSSETDSLNLNMVRILKSYTGTEETREEELKNAEAIYSVKIDL